MCPTSLQPRERWIGEAGGTAVTVQAMVFGNLDDRSGTGVISTRDPTGATRGHYGEWLPRGQGEDVVSGAFDPLPLDAMVRKVPEAHAELVKHSRLVGELASEDQNIEFTVESGRLRLLQCRRAKVHATHDQSARTGVVPDGAEVLATGRPACPGVATGIVITDVDEAEARALEGVEVILARPTTCPHDVSAMSVVAGILTEVGGATSHATVISRELGVPCIVGVGAGALKALEGTTVTVDARSGQVFQVAPA